MSNTNISVILPVHELDDTTKPMFANAIKSIATQKIKPDEVVIVAPKDSQTMSYIKNEFDFESLKSIITFVDNDGKTDVQSQLNLGVSMAKCDWISFLEFDDEYALIWFDNVVKYRAAHKDVEIFMPLIIDVDKDNVFQGFTNEAVWAQSFSDELGILDNNALLAYQNFSIDGIVMKKELFEQFGGFKSNVKLTFIYEFLLRMTFKSVKTMVIPKFGYKHVNQRPNSLFANYKETMKPDENRWWIAQAKKEYYFAKDREITYTEQIS